MTPAITESDEALHREADGLLDAGLRDAIATYGEVHVIGSYALRLMTWRDLDIDVVRDPPDLAAFLQLGSAIAALLEPHRARRILTHVKSGHALLRARRRRPRCLISLARRFIDSSLMTRPAPRASELSASSRLKTISARLRSRSSQSASASWTASSSRLN